MEKLDRPLEVLDKATGPNYSYFGCGIILILAVFTCGGSIIGARMVTDQTYIRFAINGGIVGLFIAVVVILGIWGIWAVLLTSDL